MLPLLGLHISYHGPGGPPAGFVLIAVAVVLLSLAACVWTASYARRKGFPFLPIFAAAFFVSFPIVLLIVALAPSRPSAPPPPSASLPRDWRNW